MEPAKENDMSKTEIKAVRYGRKMPASVESGMLQAWVLPVKQSATRIALGLGR